MHDERCTACSPERTSCRRSHVECRHWISRQAARGAAGGAPVQGAEAPAAACGDASPRSYVGPAACLLHLWSPAIPPGGAPGTSSNPCSSTRACCSPNPSRERTRPWHRGTSFPPRSASAPPARHDVPRQSRRTGAGHRASRLLRRHQPVRRCASTAQAWPGCAWARGLPAGRATGAPTAPRWAD